MNQQAIQARLQRYLRCDVTPEVIASVERLMQKHYRETGERFNLQPCYMRWIRKWDAERLLLRRLKAAAGLAFPDWHQPEKRLWMTVIQKAVEDLTHGWYMAGKHNQKLPETCRTAIEYFDSPLFDQDCTLLGIDPEWAYELVEKYWEEIRR